MTTTSNPPPTPTAERAERLLGRRADNPGKAVTLFDPAELEFRCPVHPDEHSAAMHLKWSEFNGFLYCELCGRDWPAALSCPDLVRATQVMLDTIHDALKRNE